MTAQFDTINRSKTPMQPRFQRIQGLFLIIFFISLFFANGVWGETHVGLEPDPDGYTYITTDEVWDEEGGPYIVYGQIVVKGPDGEVATLTIMPGVEVRFEGAMSGLLIGNSFENVSNNNGGTGLGVLVARGEEGREINFKSNSNDPEPGAWDGIHFLGAIDNSNTIMEHCKISSAQRSYICFCSPSLRFIEFTNCAYGLILGRSSWSIENCKFIGNRESISVLSGSSVTIKNCLFSGEAGRSIVFEGTTTATIENCNFSENGDTVIDSFAKTISVVNCNFNNNIGRNLNIKNATRGNIVGNQFTSDNYIDCSNIVFLDNIMIYDNDHPIRATANSVESILSLFSDNTTNRTVNLDENSYLEVSGDLRGDATWTNVVKYRINYLNIGYYQNRATLTLEPGVQFFFSENGRIETQIYSTLYAVGEADNPIVFTSDQNDPTPGYWDYLSLSSSSRMENCIVEYGGSSGKGNIYLYNSSPAILSSLIQNSSNYGIYIRDRGSDNATISCNEIKDNEIGIFVTNAAPQIRECGFEHNHIHGVQNATASLQVDARGNWWGHADGPGSSAEADTVDGNVLVDPWRATPIDCRTNDSPFAAQSPQPNDGATNVFYPNLSVELDWDAYDPNNGDTLTYDVLRGIGSSASLEPLEQDLSTSSYTIRNIQSETTYYWQVISRDNHGASTKGPIWHFTTGAPQPDLQITDITWSPNTNLAGGQSVAFKATLHNSGPGALQQNVRINFYVNGNSIGYERVTTGLAPGASVDVDLGQSWTALIRTDNTVTVHVDNNTQIVEDYENNNSRTEEMGDIADTTQPVRSRTAPTENAFLKTVSSIDIFVNDPFGGVLDNAATLNSLAVHLGSKDGPLVDGTKNVIASGGRFYFTPGTTPLPDGVYYVSMTAYDTAGHSLDCSYIFTVDNDAPAPPDITGGDVFSGTLQAYALQEQPVQNRSNETPILVTGDREDNTEIYIGRRRFVDLGSGPWSLHIALNQGDQTLEISSRDAAGNYSDSVYLDIFVDTRPPDVAGITPANSTFTNSPPGEVTISYTETGSGLDSNATAFILTDGNFTISGSWIEENNQLAFTPTNPLTDNTYTINARLVDKLKNQRPVQSVFTVDTEAPNAPEITSAKTPTNLDSETIQGRKEEYAALLLDDVQVIDSTRPFPQWEQRVDLTEGENTFAFVAQDRAGNQSESTTVTIVLDKTPPPPVTDIEISGDGVGTSILLNWNKYDTGTAPDDLLKYNIYYKEADTDGNGAPVAFTSVEGFDDANATVLSGSFSHLVPNLTAGTTYCLAVVAVDQLGNMDANVTAVLATPIDTQPPGKVNRISVRSFADQLEFSWQAPETNAHDLAGYKIYFNGSDTAEQRTEAKYVATGLASAGAYTIEIKAFDGSLNESDGVIATGYTWLDNPLGLTAEAFNGYVDLNWQPVRPEAYLDHYAIYKLPDGNATSVGGMTPVLTSANPQAKVAGLDNMQTYHFAVTAVNLSGGQNPNVMTRVSVIPNDDEDGPQITSVQIDGQAMTNGYEVTGESTVTVNTSDPSGVSRVDFLLDEILLNTDFKADYQCELDALAMENGSHTLTITAYDTLDNNATVTHSFEVAIPEPNAPVITQPADEHKTNQSTITVKGRADRGSQVILYLEGSAVGDPIDLDDQNNFSTTLTLNDGPNRIRAAAQNRNGLSPQSAEITVFVDRTQPSAPTNVAAQAIEAGVIRLTWSLPSGKLPAGYNIYRSETPFTDIAGAELVNNDLVAGTAYRDLPPQDGTWYYRITSVDAVFNESDPSLEVSATSDSVLPHITAIQYAPRGNVDPVSGAVAPGDVDVTVTLSETLMATPFLSLTPEAGVPISIALTQSDDTVYTGSFAITDITPSGTAYAVFSGRDRVGNRGTEIDKGLTLLLDTDGPAIRRLVIDPATPIQNDVQAPVSITVTIGLNEAVGQVAPVLDYLLSGAGRSAATITGLAQIDPESGDEQTWQATFQLPADAGEAEVETLSFAHQTQDGLGNISDRILAPNHFQVYQGDLPPLAAPTGLTAQVLPGGRIDLSWDTVQEAIGYQLYRQAPDESELTLLTRLEGQSLTFQDATPMDGTFLYAVSSLRGENGQEAESSLSATLSVNADAEAPPAPQLLPLKLIPQGIEAQWEAVTTETVTYRLYRSDEMDITTIEGLTPLEALFNRNKALDRNPSPTAHTYVVTAVDEAGNESAPSNARYLDFALLPAATITVEQIDRDKPTLTWTHPGGSLAGFNVSMGPVGQSVQVNTDPVTDTTMTDSGYAGDAREYTVIAINRDNVESKARTIMLPAIEIERTDDKLLRRGIMNRLAYTVTNLGDQSLTDLQVIVHLYGIDHPSDTFSLAGNQSITVPVTVAGYTDLEDIESVDTIVQMTPNDGETARIVKSGEIQVGEGMLALQIYTENFVRGGTGVVRFTLENTGEADTEIIIARKQGREPSDEIQYRLLNQDGNVLSVLDFKQEPNNPYAVTLTDQTTVARIPAGKIFESGSMEITVPANAPDDLTLVLGIENVYHNLSRDDHQLTMRGLTSTKTVSIVETDYNGAITAITPQVTSGIEDVQITGRALLREDSQPVPNAPLNLIITLNGFERNIELFTDDNGDFDYTFTPLPNETGTYTVAALHPDLTERPVQATFTVTKVALQPANIRLNMPKNYQETIPIQVSSGTDTTVHNLRLEYDAWDQPANGFTQGVTYTLGDTIAQLDPGQKTTIDVTIESDNSAADIGGLVFRLVSDETTGTPWGYVHIEAQLTEGQPYLTCSPHHVETGVVLDNMVTETVTLENKGLAALEGVSLSLIGENYADVPDWVLLNANTDVGTLAVGDKLPVPVTFAPPAGATEGLHTFYLRVSADDYPITDIGFYVSVSPDGIGSALFKVKNIYTGTLNDRNEVIQGLEGARITLQNEKDATLTYNGTTDAYGEYLFEGYPAGIYKYTIKAAGHQEQIGRLWIKPGLTTSEELFLAYSAVTVEWSVQETTIQDEYHIALNITYETDVPAPVVVCEPATVLLPDMKAGDVYNGEFTLTNHGLILADNLKVNLPDSDAYIQYELLADPPAYLGAKERITIPYRLTCLQDLSRDEDVESGGAGGGYRNCMTIEHSGFSSNGCPYSGTAPHCFSRPVTSSGGSNTGSPVGTGWYTYGGGGGYCNDSSCDWGYGSIGSSGTGIGSGADEEVCTPAPNTTPDSDCGGNGPGGDNQCKKKDCQREVCTEVGSSVNLFMRSFTDHAVDLSVKVPGGTIDIERSFHNNGYEDQYRDQWYFRHARTLVDKPTIFPKLASSVGAPSSNTGGSSSGSSSSISKPVSSFPINASVVTADGITIKLKPIKHGGVKYRPDANKTTINMGAGEQVVFRPDMGTDVIIYKGDNIWRWEDQAGNWEEYYYHLRILSPPVTVNAPVMHKESPAGYGELIAYGDRHGTLAQLSYENELDNQSETPVELGKLTGIYDRNGRQVYWFDYDKTADDYDILQIHDLDNRQIEYEMSSGLSKYLTSANMCYGVNHLLIHRYTDAEQKDTFYYYDKIALFNWSGLASTIQIRPGGPVIGGSPSPSSSSTSHSGSSGMAMATMPCFAPPRIGLSSVVDPAGRTKTIRYDINGAVSSVLDDNDQGYNFKYTYDEKNKEYYAQVSDTSGRIKEVYIDLDGDAARVDVNGRTVKTYGKEGRTYSITDENGNTTYKTYDEWDNLVKVVYPDPDGTHVDYQYHPDLHKVVKKIDENQVVTRYDYNDDGRLEYRIEALGTDFQRTTEFLYNGEGYLEYIIRHGGTDKDGYITPEATTYIQYDDDGNIRKITDPEQNVTEFTEYDAAGNVKKKIDPRNKLWQYTYDDTGRLKTVTDPLMHETGYKYIWDSEKKIYKVIETDPEQNVTEYEYDQRDHLKKIINPELEETLFENTFDGRVLEQTDGESHRVQYRYDADGRLAKHIDGNGNEIELGYTGGDAGGCATCGSSAGSGDQPTFIAFPTFDREIKYDGRGRKYAERDILKDGTVHLTEYRYDGVGNLVEKVDAEDRVTKYHYDKLNRLELVEQQAYDEDGQERWLQTRYKYDKRDNLRLLIDAEGHETKFHYDLNNRLKKEIRPLGEETSYDYDAAGNLTEKIDAKQQRTEYVYDDAGRLDFIHYYNHEDDETPVKTVDFGYDDNGFLTGYDDDITSADYVPDKAGRKVTETVNYPGSISLSHTYTYYDNGLKESYTGPDNIRIGYLYDDNNQLTGVVIPNVGIFSVNEYRWNRPGEETLPGGGKRHYTYDDLMRVEGIAVDDPGGNPQLNYGYKYDNVDNITTRQTPDGDVIYDYDDLYRLTDVDNPAGPDEQFRYDDVGNRKRSADTTGEWDYNENNELNGYDDVSFDYDHNGNMTERNAGGVITKFFYNLEDRLERVEDADGNVIATYYYDPFGRRLWKEVDGARTYFHYNDEGLAGEYDETGGLKKTYGWKPGGTWSTDPLFMRDQSGKYFWYHNDHLGTPQMMTTSSGAVAWKAKYTAFGKATVDSSSTVDNPLRFPGQYEDAETGLHYNLWRYYLPDVGRYITTDPIGFFGGDFNLFAYSVGNPLIFFDPEGLSWLDWKVWDYVEATSDFWAGFGDTISFGITDWVREQMGTNSVVDKCSGSYKGGRIAGIAHGFISGGAVGSVAGKAGLKAGMKRLSNGTKGRIGEGLSIIKHRIRGSRLLGTQQRIPGQRSIADSVWRGRSGRTYFVESKFGTSGLTAAQRAARDALGSAYRIDRWGYSFFGRLGSITGGTVGSVTYGSVVRATSRPECGCQN